MARQEESPVRINYRWWANIYRGGVYETAEPVDDKQVFATFGEARTALGDHFSAMETHAGAARHRARNLKKAAVMDREWFI